MTLPGLPHGLVLAALLAPVPTPNSATGHPGPKEPQPAGGAAAAAAPDLRPLYVGGADLGRNIVAAHAVGRAVPLSPFAAGPADFQAVLLRPAQPLSSGGNVLNVADTAPGQAAVRAEQPWARATAPQQKVGGAYVTLTSSADDRLVGVSSPVAGRVEVHEMRMDGNVMRMRELADGLPLPAGKVVALAPGGSHIMLMDLKQPLVAGQVIPMQLRFRIAPPLDLQVRVAAVGAGVPPGAGHGDTPGHVH